MNPNTRMGEVMEEVKHAANGKTLLRRSAIESRNKIFSDTKLFLEIQASLNRRLGLLLARLMQEGTYSHIASYLPFQSEFDLNLHNHFYCSNRNAGGETVNDNTAPLNHLLGNTPWLYPRAEILNHGKSNALHWFDFAKSSVLLEKNRWGIQEAPSENCLPCFATSKAKWIVVVPALMVDSKGFRLGYGKGFYDRFINENVENVTTVSCVPEDSRIPSLPIDPWDLPVNFCITEKKIYPQ